ncbi:thiamine pyrophosphate-binding protein [Cohnella sp. LGH]|uniref:thiamine pyrophosphate-binding protein n=1 Tax=Cohnella sp. LGH TaxID=1619153 RepID=UPI001ADC4B08|nr:thiamine pyrophosphate-binding protein [Cohnella sp. LGH]QTH42321.1 thiamine pyrophosphate-binding protein [Cohnella sp. LGH]
MKVSDYIVDFISKKGVSHVFEFIGGAIVHLIDSIALRDDMKTISVRHEQSGAFAAECYARINGKLGVAMATSGPGALNLVTGIGSCYFDSVPCLFITGQVNTYEYKFDRPVRQIGFQETDIVSVVKSLTKYAEMVVEANKIRFHLEKAVYFAQSGRPGPVLLDIPMNLQRQDVDPEQLESFFDSTEYKEIVQSETYRKAVPDDQIQLIIRLIQEAKRPIILAGGGIRTANGQQQFEHFVNRTNIPVACSLMGLDVLPHTHPSYVGLIGSYGNRYANMALANADFILILGSRLDTRQTGTRPDTFGRAAIKVHIDVDANELNAKVNTEVVIHAELKDFLDQINGAIANHDFIAPTAWNEKIQQFRSKYSELPDQGTNNTIDPNRFMEMLSSNCNEGDIVCLDVGQHQMWASQSFHLKEQQRLINSGGMGAMGFAIPAAIGSAFLTTNNVIAIVGDGAVQLNIQELDTIKRYKLPIKIFVVNNNSLGMVRQFQELYFDGRKQSTVYDAPNFCNIAMAYEIESFNIINWSEAERIVQQALNCKGPVLVNVEVSKDSAVNPKLVVNRPIEDMYPHLDREELREMMLIDLVEEVDVPK